MCLAENSKHCRKRLNCKPRQKEKNDISKAEGMGKGRDGPSHKNLLVRQGPASLLPDDSQCHPRRLANYNHPPKFEATRTIDAMASIQGRGTDGGQDVN